MKKISTFFTLCLFYLSSAHAVTVHDPSIVKNGNTYYVFGSPLAAARSNDLVNWTRFAEGVNSRNPLFADVTRELAEALSWAETNTLWAAEVRQLPDGKFYMYYNACRGDSPLSALGVAVADNVAWPQTAVMTFASRAPQIPPALTTTQMAMTCAQWLHPAGWNVVTHPSKAPRKN